MGCVVSLSAARAQAPAPVTVAPEDLGLVPRIGWNFGGSLLVPLGPLSSRMNVGGGFAAGLSYNPSAVLGVQFEYGANWSSLSTGKLANAGIGGSASVQYFNIDLLIRPTHPGNVFGFYLIGGGGLYYRYAHVTRVTGTTIAPYCDPWLYYCSAVPVSAQSIIGSRSSWDWGLDAGAGVTFAIAPPLKLYVEARYHYVWGPSFTDSTGNKRSADSQFLPIILGVRF
jgi:opacity protein-like surface antigen